MTAPQGLFMMNSDEIEKASAKFAERLQKEAGADLGSAVDLRMNSMEFLRVGSRSLQ